MAQKTWVGSDYVSDVLLNDIPDNDTELYSRVEALETEVENARDGETSLLAKETVQDTALETLETSQGVLIDAVTDEVEAGRAGFASLLDKQQDQDSQIEQAKSVASSNYPTQTGNAGKVLSTDGTIPEWVPFGVTVTSVYLGTTLS
jgi:hypothetical protein